MTLSSYLFVIPGLAVLTFEGSFFATVFVSETGWFPVRMWQGRDSLLSVIATLFRKKRVLDVYLCTSYGFVVETHVTLGGWFLLHTVYCRGTLFAAVRLPGGDDQDDVHHSVRALVGPPGLPSSGWPDVWIADGARFDWPIHLR